MPTNATSNKIILILEILSYKNLNSCFEIHVQNELFTSIRAKLVLLSLSYAWFRMPMVPEYSKVYSAKVYLPIPLWGGTNMTPIYYVIYSWSEFSPSQIKRLTYPSFETNNDSLSRFIVVKDENILHFFIHRFFITNRKDYPLLMKYHIQ